LPSDAAGDAARNLPQAIQLEADRVVVFATSGGAEQRTANHRLYCPVTRPHSCDIASAPSRGWYEIAPAENQAL
jgi:hypothetical protein